VCQAYLDLLHRMPDPGGLGFWTAALTGGHLTRVGVAEAIQQSTEYRLDLVDGWYQRYLHRTPAPVEGAFWVAIAGAGVSNETIQADFLGSPEYFAARGGSTNDGFLTALYLDVLNRPADPGGRATWDAALSHGLTRMQVAGAILSSPERVSDVVAGWYGTYLHRLSAPSEVAFWGWILAHGATDAQVVGSIIGSLEYYNRFAL
jgi:hypothetical protein